MTNDLKQSARDHAFAMALSDIDVARPDLFQNDTMWPYFERLRRDEPVHYCANGEFGPYWSITKFDDIMAVDTNHQVFSSEATLGGITLAGGSANVDPLPMFIAMDPPKHDSQRKTVSPAVSPVNLNSLAPIIRQRAGVILDELPIGVEFDWVDKVSIELTTMTLATLFDFPFAERRKLTRWSDVVTARPGHGIVDTIEQRHAEMMEFYTYFIGLWNDRVNSSEDKGDLISMLAHSPATRSMQPMEYFGNVVLLTVGGNDTTRNTITGSIVALNENPDQYTLLRERPDLIPSMVSETIRWQTPLAYMRRTALSDIEFRGKHIKKGDKLAMWYISGNRDSDVIARADDYLITRENPRHHMSFGFGIHRCVGNRLAELQLQIIWEEILKRFANIRQVGSPKRTYSTFVHGYETLPVVIDRRL